MTILTDELVEKARRAYMGVVWETTSEDDPIRAALSAVLPDVIAAERERCARIADDEDEDIAYSGQNNNWKVRKSALKEVAAAIRKGDA